MILRLVSDRDEQWMHFFLNVDGFVTALQAVKLSYDAPETGVIFVSDIGYRWDGTDAQNRYNACFIPSYLQVVLTFCRASETIESRLFKRWAWGKIHIADKIKNSALLLCG
jgi:hypothetical protein